MGFTPQLILSIDVGTTQSAVAVYYSNGELEEPVVTHVARWPGQEASIHEEKVPSALLYDAEGNLLACGAEAASRDKVMEAEENGWYYVEHFKMHLHPAEVLKTNNLRLKGLPGNLTLFTVYVDFIKYILAHTRQHLKDYIGVDPWIQFGRQAQIVLTHPNRWGVEQQKFLQRVAIAAGLITQSGLSRLAFVEEGEASASYCLSTNPTLAARLPVDAKFVICDAGGSTADISAYKVRRTENGIVYIKELEVPRCLDAGGVRVDANFTEFLESRLLQAHEEADDDIPGIVSDGLRDFQRTGKRRFRSSTTTLQVQIGARSMRSVQLPINKGVLSLRGTDAEAFFSPSVQQIVDALRHITSRDSRMAIILTGNFGESPYMRGELERNFGPDRLILSNSANSKAVAIGGLRLIVGGKGIVLVDRVERPWKTMVVRFIRRIAKIFP